MATITPKEKDGKIIAYKFRACVGRDENGKQVSRATTWKIPENLSMTRLTSAAQRAAADWEKQARSEYEKDLYDPERIKAREVDRTKTDFARFVLEEWYPICIDNGERKPKTVSFYHDTTKNIVAHFQGQIVQKITAPDIQKFLIYLRTEKGFAPQNVHHHYRTLNMIFAYAMRQEIIVKNPMDKVDRPKLARKKVDALSQDEAAAFFAALREQPLAVSKLVHPPISKTRIVGPSDARLGLKPPINMMNPIIANITPDITDIIFLLVSLAFFHSAAFFCSTAIRFLFSMSILDAERGSHTSLEAIQMLLSENTTSDTETAKERVIASLSMTGVFCPKSTSRAADRSKY